MKRIPGLLLLSLVAPAVLAGDALPKVAETFDVNGHKAYLYAAPNPAPGKPWVWFAPTLKGLSLVTRKAYFEGFLNAGVSIAGCDLGEVRGAPASSAEFTKFYEEMVKRGWSPKPILIGQSRGGLMMLGWAMRNPDKPQAFVGIYPVCNLGTWGMKNTAVTLADYQLTEQEMRDRMKEFNPLDNLQVLADHKLPMFVVQGDSDKAVPHEENAKILQERYKSAGGSITVKLIPGEGHAATPSFFESPELLAFVLKQAGAIHPESSIGFNPSLPRPPQTDYRGFQPGSKLKDPYTGEILIVPDAPDSGD